MKKIAMLALVLAMMMMICTPAHAAVVAQVGPTPNQVTLYWDANGEIDLAGYKIYRSPTSGTGYIQIGTVGVMAQPTFITPPLGNGTHYFVVTAYNTGGMESGYSNQVSKTIAMAPAPPKGLRLTILEAIASLFKWMFKWA